MSDQQGRCYTKKRGMFIWVVMPADGESIPQDSIDTVEALVFKRDTDGLVGDSETIAEINLVEELFALRGSKYKK